MKCRFCPLDITIIQQRGKRIVYVHAFNANMSWKARLRYTGHRPEPRI